VLLLAALIGNTELHADNSIALGKGLYKLIARQTLPQQAVPSKSLLCETFCYSYGEVAGDAVRVECNKDYFFRPRICFSAWRHGKIKELNCLVGNHPLEDVIHIHAWVQLHYMHMGRLPSYFYFLPGMVPRSAELVPGCVYPVKRSDNLSGIVCVCPGGRTCAIIQMHGYLMEAMNLEKWQSTAVAMGIQVGPLISRKGGVIRMDDGTLEVLVPQMDVDIPDSINDWKPEFSQILHPENSKTNYLNYSGNYTLFDGQQIAWEEAHDKLVALGTHVLVAKENIERVRVPRGDHTHVKGWLRYPDECDEQGDSKSVFIAFRVASQHNEMEDVCVLPLSSELCSLAADMPDVTFVDYLQS
jgi:hypothetical protein